MHVHVLASGSTGNSVLLDFEDTKILVDAGISTRRIKNSLAEIGVEMEALDGVFITHEHRDHISGLPTMTKKYKLPVYATSDTWNNMYCQEEIPVECRQLLPESMDIGKVKMEPFRISHDAADPVGFRFYCGSKKCSVVIDLGFVTDSVKKAISLSDVLVLESNHDPEMLKNGSYPWHLKKRIMSNQGHLSNFDAAWTLARLERKSRTQVLLAHMSKENNCPELAEGTVRDILTEQGCKLESELDLHVTYPDQRVSIRF